VIIDHFTDPVDYLQGLFFSQSCISGYYQEILPGRMFLTISERRMESMVGVTTFGEVVGWRYIPFYSIENEREILRVIVIASPSFSKRLKIS